MILMQSQPVFWRCSKIQTQSKGIIRGYYQTCIFGSFPEYGSHTNVVLGGNCMGMDCNSAPAGGVFQKINSLVKECQRSPYTGSGKPEALKQNLSGFWSRRITEEHRLVYKVDDDILYIAQCRYHY